MNRLLSTLWASAATDVEVTSVIARPDTTCTPALTVELVRYIGNQRETARGVRGHKRDDRFAERHQAAPG